MPRSRTRRPLLVAGLLAAGTLLGFAARSGAEPPGGPSPTVRPTGVVLGVTLGIEPYFKWTATDARSGLIGTLEGPSRDFIDGVKVEVLAGREALTMALRASREAFRIRREVEFGQLQTPEVKGDVSIVRMKSKDLTYVCAGRLVGRTPLWMRAVRPKKEEGAVLRLLQSLLARVEWKGDEQNGWIPSQVKAVWTREDQPDLTVIYDETLKAEVRAEILATVRATHALVRKGLPQGAAPPYPPVVRLSAVRDMLEYLSGRHDLADVDAAYLPFVGELFVAPRRKSSIDAPSIASAAAAQALHFALGTSEAEPLLVGVRRIAEAAAATPPAGASATALDRVKKKEALSWRGLCMTSSMTRWARDPSPEAQIDAELSTRYLYDAPGPQAKSSFAGWAAAMRKWGHPDAGSEAAIVATDPAKLEAEFWAYWASKTEGAQPPPKRGK